MRNVDYIRSLSLQVIDLDGLPFTYRGETTDEIVADEIFKAGKYVLPLPEDFQPKVIIDCGSNIGYSTLFFANVYPDAQIYSIEPEKNNFKFLRFNTIFYDNIHVINSAVWDKETCARLETTELGEAGYMTVETGEDDKTSFKTTTLSKIIAENNIEQIDLLKIDIEGSEKEVFGAENVDEWLSKVKVMAIVLHDELRAGASYEFFKAISKYRWKFSPRGEVLLFIREEEQQNAPQEENHYQG
ncbi:MAG: FkbM family methyltransferase [Selenomonadaceae bacterium]|nr:FkbM family methyltransferase [Selenomonadaceae bacterium]